MLKRIAITFLFAALGALCGLYFAIASIRLLGGRVW